MDADEIQARALLTQRKIRLAWYEEQITMKGAEIGRLFRDLRNDSLKPWLASSTSLEEYCRARWGLSLRRVEQLAAGEGVKALLGEAAQDDPPVKSAVDRMKDGALREIAKVPEPERVTVIKAVVSSGAPRVTAAAIRQAVEKAGAPRKKAPAIIDAETGQPESAVQCCPTCKRPL